MEIPLEIAVPLGVVIAAAFAYLAARGLRLRRLSARFYYRPRREPVPFAAIVRDVYPDAGLSPREREKLRKSGIDGAGPPWSEWLHRHSLAKLSIMGRSGESAWAGAITLHKIHETDGHVAEAVSHLLRRRVEAFADLRPPPHWRTSAAPETKKPAAYDRQFAERIVADSLRGRAHTVVFSEHPGHGSSHCAVDGRRIDLRGLLQFDMNEHLEEFPGSDGVTSGDFFRAEEGAFTIDHAKGSYKLSMFGGTGLDGAFGSDKALAAGTAAASSHAPTLALAGSIDFQNPFLTLGLSTLREIRLLRKKHTNLLTSVRNIGLDAAGTGIGSFAGAKAGATIGTAVAPGMGSVVGAIIGGIGGAFAGRSISNKIKFSRAEAARAHYEKKILEFQQKVQEVTGKAMAALETLRAREQAALAAAGLKRVRELEAFTTRLEARTGSARVLPAQKLGQYFSLCENDIRGEAKEIDTSLSNISFRESVVWPGEAAVRLFVQRKQVLKNLSELIAARSALLDPSCSLNEVERTEICLELLAAFGGREKEIRDHLLAYRSAAERQLDDLLRWPDAPLRELARTRTGSIRRLSSLADALRRRTEAQLKPEVTKAKRSQTRFAKELRKLGLIS